MTELSDYIRCVYGPQEERWAVAEIARAALKDNGHG